ncbi:MAG: hypothetical protein Q8O89_06010 [Nanoarchaeota archaeon]|nr:hypothetical protein [Nanoarchaeota archaeon]
MSKEMSNEIIKRLEDPDEIIKYLRDDLLRADTRCTVDLGYREVNGINLRLTKLVLKNIGYFSISE